MGALKRIDYFDERLLTALCEGICNGNTRLSAVANETLSYFYNQNKYKTFIGTGVKKYAGLEWQKKLLAS